MSIVDANRSPAQLVALADGLGQLPPGVREDPIAGLAQQVQGFSSLREELMRADAEFDYARLSGRSVDAAKEHLANASHRFNVAIEELVKRADDVPARNRLPENLKALKEIKPFDRSEAWTRDTIARIQRLTATIEAFEAPSDERLYRENDQVRAICDRLAKLSRFELVEAALTDPKSGLLHRLPREALLYGYGVADGITPVALRGGEQAVRRLMLEPGGDTSDLTGAVRGAIDAFRGHPVQAVILFSDGRQVGGDGAVPYALSTSGVPVISVASAMRGKAKDVSILNVTLPATQFSGETVTARVELDSHGYAGRPAVVTAAAGEIRQTRKITLNDKVRTVDLPLTLDNPGSQRIVVTVEPLPGESSEANNEVHRWVKVLNDKTRIAAFAGAPSWDFQYLRNALSRAPWVELTDRIIARDEELSLTPEEILQLDTIILSDIDAEALRPAQWDAVHQLVVERGGSLLLITGDERLPENYSGHVLLTDLLPYVPNASPTWRVWPGEEAFFRLVPSADARRLEALRLEEDPSAALQRWHALPGMYRVLPLVDLKPNTRPLLIERESGAAVLTESRLGMGRVFFMGANETWRWRYKTGAGTHDRFWLQLLRYASEEPYAVVDEGMALDVDRVWLPPGEPMFVRARVRDASGAPTPSDQWRIDILKEGEVFRAEQLPFVNAPGTGRFAGSITGLPAGEYEIAMTAHDKTIRLPIHVSSSEEAEMVNLSGDESLLRRLAASTGGEMLHLDEVERLPDTLEREQARRSRFAEVSLWDSPYLFAFVLACLAAEWALRKRLGLV